MGIEKSRPVLITGCSTGIGRATAERLVADHEARFDLDAPVVDVEVGAADPACLDADDRVVRRQQLGLRDILHLDLARGLEGDRAHG